MSERYRGGVVTLLSLADLFLSVPPHYGCLARFFASVPLITINRCIFFTFKNTVSPKKPTKIHGENERFALEIVASGPNSCTDNSVSWRYWCLCMYVWTEVWQSIEIVKRNGEGTGKQRGGGDLCRYGTMGPLLQRCKYPKLTDWSLLALFLSLPLVPPPPFPPIRVFVAFISLALSFSRGFRYALKARRAFARLGFAQSVTMQRL